MAAAPAVPVPERMPLQGVDIAAKLAAEYQPKLAAKQKLRCRYFSPA